MQHMHRPDHMLTTQRMQQLQRETNRIYQDLLALEQRHPQIFGNPPQNGLPAQNSQGQLDAPNPPTVPQFAPRPPLIFQNLIAQQQRDRAAAGHNGINDTIGTTTPPTQSAGSLSGRASPNIHPPEHSRTYVREGLGPNGERWQVTVNETMATFPIVRPSSTQSVRSETNSRVGGNHLNQQNPQPFPLENNGLNPLNNGNQTHSAQGNVLPSGLLPMHLPPIQPHAPTYSASFADPLAAAYSSNDGSMVYILSSPSGPRALLVSNANISHISQQPVGSHFNPPVTTPQNSQQARAGDNDADNPNGANVLPQPHARHDHHRDGNAEEGQNIFHAGMHPANPGAGPLAVQVLPHIWLIIRLIGFIWFFTSGSNSWSRLLTISALAVIVFIVNTGVLNGFAEQIWGPVRRHLEGLLPLAGPGAAGIPAANEGAAPQPGEQQPQRPQGRRGRVEPDPAQVAARLLEQHRRENAGWLVAQIRRAEHAMLLFLASLVPGVGERHIAAREAETAAIEAERARQEQERAEREAAEAENDAGETGAAGNSGADQRDQNAEQAAQAHPPAEDAAAVQPLIDI